MLLSEEGTVLFFGEKVVPGLYGTRKKVNNNQARQKHILIEDLYATSTFLVLLVLDRSAVCQGDGDDRRNTNAR